VNVAAPPPPAPNRSQHLPAATPAEQERLVLHLAERIRGLLAGDNDERRVIYQRFPSKVLQLGILPALPAPDPTTGENAEELARKLNRAPSTMGLDFLVSPPAEGGNVVIDVEAAFSVYLQRYPTRDAQERFHTGAEPRQEDEDAFDLGDEVIGKSDGGDDQGAQGSGPRNMRLFNVFERFDVATDRLSFTLTGDRGEDSRDLGDAVCAGIGADSGQTYADALVDARTVYPFWGARGQVLPSAALNGDQVHFQSAITASEGGARAEPLSAQDVRLHVGWQPDEGGLLRIKLTLANQTLEPRRERRPRARAAGDDGSDGGKAGRRALVRDLELFNSRMRVYGNVGDFTATHFLQSPKDFRYRDLRWVWCTGINCVGRRLQPVEDHEEPLTTETWPLYRQSRMESRRRSRPDGPDNLELRFDELANAGRMPKALARVSEAMKEYEADWQRQLDAWTEAASRDACAAALEQFRGDIVRFERGRDLLRRDHRLRGAFLAANEVFRRSGVHHKPARIDSWRLFQVVYLVCQLAALHAREADLAANPGLACELDTVDVLWFPTGGGKTEAYLGLILVALFYDRLRGKERGVTAVLRFPLRMLSVQQLQRILVVVWFAERLRAEYQSAGGITVDDDTFELDGDPFALGYWVGLSNSPNQLARSDSGRVQDHIVWWVRHIADEGGDDRRIVTVCPNPECAGKVSLHADELAVRLRHVCDTCGGELPLYFSDDEVYRYLPAVLVCTVDKLAHIARADQFINILAGPAYRCPDHGYFTWHEGGTERNRAGAPVVDDRCLARDLCKRPKSEYIVVGPTKDPCPALQIQDELHLLQEELGTFNAHYETLMDVLYKRLGSGKPTKMLAATATIEAFEAQVQQLYARRARVFPSNGLALGQSFYVSTATDTVRRVYVGALPYRTDVTEFGGLVQVCLHAEVIRMIDDPAYGLAALGLVGVRDAAWIERILIDYELTLGYVNRKADADRIAYQLTRAHGRGDLPEEVESHVLIGGSSSLADIAETLNRIQDQHRDEPDRTKRLRALVATSVISHGVDLDALNLMVINNMTPDVAQYVQSSSRSGRSHIGLVIVSFDRRSARQRSFFQYFLKYHEFIDRLIAPVPVNRFARFAATRTVPGIIAALMLHVFGRERLARAGTNAQRVTPKTLRIGNQGRKWFTDADPPSDKPAALRELVVQALGVGAQVIAPDDAGGYRPVPVFEHRMENALVAEATDEVDKQIELLRNPGATGSTPERMRPRPLTSFRDVDEPLTFTPTPRAAAVQGALVRAAGKPSDDKD
jgi:hypothetical protein